MIRLALTLVLAMALPLAALAASGQQQGAGETLQHLAQRLLKGKQGSIVAIEPQTGRVLAMASTDKAGDGVNRATEKEYSPGSTFKTAQALMMLSCGRKGAGAEEEGWLDTLKTYPCHEGFTQGGIRIGCHKHPAPCSVIGAIGYSCNSFFCKAFQEMMDDRTATTSKWRAIEEWAQFMHGLGLGGSQPGLIPDSAYMASHYRAWNGTTIMWLGMGQGEVSATMLQLCNLAAIIANGGWWMDNGEKRLCPATPEALDIVKRGMRLAVTHGTAYAINTPQYEICGKTGTAENEGKDHSAFIGFAPMDNARVAVAVYVENGGMGADIAAPLAALIIEHALNGHLSPASQKKASRWEHREVKITPVEKPVSWDDL